MGIEELKEEALRLSPKARAYLARELLASLEAMSEGEIEELWVDEAIRRDEEFDKGAARAYPADEVLARARVHGQVGNLNPQDDFWDCLIRSLDHFSDDFMEERNQIKS